MELLKIIELKKRYIGPDHVPRAVIDMPAFELAAGNQAALEGESGCGKTTLLNLIAGILTPDAGQIQVAGTDVARLAETQRDRFRARHIGYIFQNFNLLPGYTCLENVLVGMAFGAGLDRSRAQQLLERVGLRQRLHHYPRQLSTGQQQRVAVARALANQPQLVLADEPTGNLDPRSAREALTLIRETCCELGAALLLVSHDREILSQFSQLRSFRELNQPVVETLEVP